MFINHKLDVVNMNAYAKFGHNPSKFSKDMSENENVTAGRTDGRTDNHKTLYPHTSYAGAIKTEGKLRQENQKEN